MFCIQLLQQLETGVGAGRLAQFYAPDGSRTALGQAKERAVQTVRAFQEEFDPMPYAHTALFSGPGRTELGGNHTDHQHGHVLCASVDMDILACAAANETRRVRIHSQGYPVVEVNLDELEAREEEKNTSAALVRGVAADAVRAMLSGAPCPPARLSAGGVALPAAHCVGACPAGAATVPWPFAAHCKGACHGPFGGAGAGGALSGTLR